MSENQASAGTVTNEGDDSASGNKVDGAKTVDSAKTVVDQALRLVGDHPKTSLVVGAGVSFLVGLELLGAALVGGAVALAVGRRRQPPAQ